MGDRLGGKMARKPLHFIWLLDLSGSMERKGKIQALNTAIREAIPLLKEAARSNPHVQVYVRAIGFATTCRWIIEEPVPIESFRWTNVDAEPRGLTELGPALAELARAMGELRSLDRGVTPAIVLVSDGLVSDARHPHFAEGLELLLAEPWGNKAVRLAINIGSSIDEDMLRRFIGHDEIAPVRADNPQRLAALLRWASTYAVDTASGASPGGPDATPPPPEPVDGDEPWADEGP